MKILDTAITLEVDTPMYTSLMAVGGRATRSEIEEILYGMCGESTIVKRVLKDNPELLPELKKALEKVSALRKKIEATMRPSLRKAEKAVYATIKTLDAEEAAGE